MNRLLQRLSATLCLGLALAVGTAQADTSPAPTSPTPPTSTMTKGAFTDAARGPTALTESTKPPVLGNAVNDDQRRTRNYAMQPPIIPHRVDGYQVDKNFNKCLDCHARANTGVSQAVPVSITHYLDRQGNVLAQVSTRRYFCQQCHVAQDAVKPIVDNTFQDVDTVIQRAKH